MYQNKTNPSEELARKISLFSEIDFKVIQRKVEKIGIKLDAYREDYLARRISYHFNRSLVSNLNEYFDKLSSDEVFLFDLIDCINVNFSYFFRDFEKFEHLKQFILPLLMNAFQHRKLKVWSVGCSIGAEIFSISFILKSLNYLESANLVASDIDREALLRAKDGKYFLRELRSLPTEYLNYFTECGEKEFSLDQSIKDAVKFYLHDISNLNSLNNKKYHLLICRNVVIYFKKELKEKLYSAFYEWLEPGGILFIGANESILGESKNKFQSLGKQFYRKVI